MGKPVMRVFLPIAVLALAALSCSTAAWALANLCEATGGTWIETLGDPSSGYCSRNKPAVSEPQTPPTHLDQNSESADTNVIEAERDISPEEAAIQSEATVDNLSTLDTYRGTSTFCDVILADNEDWFGQKTSDEVTITVDKNGLVNGLLICTTNTGVRQVPDDPCTYDGTNTITATLSGQLTETNHHIPTEISWVYYVLRWNCPPGDGTMIDEAYSAQAVVTITGNTMTGAISWSGYPVTFEAYLQK